MPTEWDFDFVVVDTSMEAALEKISPNPSTKSHSDSEADRTIAPPTYRWLDFRKSWDRNGYYFPSEHGTMSYLSRIMTGLIVLIAVAVSSAIGLAFLAGGLTPTGAHLAITLGAAAGFVTAWFTQEDSAPPATAWEVLLLIFFAMASLRAFIWLIYAVGDEWRVLSPNNLGDISIHLQFIRYLASGPRFWPESPILSGSPLVYPLGMDLWNSLLLLSGLPVERGSFGQDCSAPPSPLGRLGGGEVRLRSPPFCSTAVSRDSLF